MQRTFLFLIFVFFGRLVQGQVKPPLAIEEFEEGLNPHEEIRLFDLKEIKARKIDTAYIIYHPASWAEYHPIINPCNCTYNDTLSRYVFDAEGRIIEHTYFQMAGKYSTTIHYDTLGERTAMTIYKGYGEKPGSKTRTLNYAADTINRKEIIINKKVDKDSLLTKIIFIKFKHGFDTAAVTSERYNSNGKLIEVQSEINKRNKREFDEEAPPDSHFQYDYDNQGRLIYFRDYSTKKYKKISYPFYGKLTETFNVSNDQLSQRNIKVINVEKEVISILFDRKHITLTLLEKGSKLIKLITILEPYELPLVYHHEIVYKAK